MQVRDHWARFKMATDIAAQRSRSGGRCVSLVQVRVVDVMGGMSWLRAKFRNSVGEERFIAWVRRGRQPFHQLLPDSLVHTPNRPGWPIF